jgi:hypothetical protein
MQAQLMGPEASLMDSIMVKDSVTATPETAVHRHP